jgi:hypothetical protein
MDIIDLMASKLQRAEILVIFKNPGSSWAQRVLPQVWESCFNRNCCGGGSIFKHILNAP